MGLLLLLASAIVIVLAVGPGYSAGQAPGVLMPLTVAQQNEFIDKHNEYRRAVQPTASGMKKLYWDAQAAVNAGDWAKECKWEHSPEARRTLTTSICGENIYKQNAAHGPSVAVEFWNNEKNNFVYGKGPKSSKELYLHYTQLSWDSSSYVGCAMARCGDFTWTVCHYCPSGNVGAEPITIPYASGPPCSKCPNTCDNKLCTNPCPFANMAGNEVCESYKSQCKTQPSVAAGCRGVCECT